MQKNVFVLAGPTGSGKDSIIRELMRRYSNIEFAVNAVTREPRPGEVDGVNYHFMTNDRFLEEMAKGNIPEHYLRKSINAYYGTYKPDIDARLARGKIVAWQGQIVGAKYLKEQYNATTIFIMPETGAAFEARARNRAPMSDAEWQERLEFTKREIESESGFYDYQIENKEGRMDEAVDAVVAILKKEGYVLE
jgi:guanylate kinase